MKWWGISYVRVTAVKPLQEERVIKFRLPIWRHGYDICCDQLRYGQRVLAWYGRGGFRLSWYFQ